jgi:hypothetical protein
MKQRCFVLCALLSLLFSGCATQPPAAPSVAKTELKRVTQLDVTTNLPVKSWNARSDTIRKHVTPPVGITFVDAATGQEIHFEGTYKIESYRDSNSTTKPNESGSSKVEPTPGGSR